MRDIAKWSTALMEVTGKRKTEYREVIICDVAGSYYKVFWFNWLANKKEVWVNEFYIKAKIERGLA